MCAECHVYVATVSKTPGGFTPELARSWVSVLVGHEQGSQGGGWKAPE